MTNANLLLDEKDDTVVFSTGRDVRQSFLDPTSNTLLVVHEDYGYFLYSLNEERPRLVKAFQKNPLSIRSNIQVSPAKYKYNVFTNKKFFYKVETFAQHNIEIIDFNTDQAHYVTLPNNKGKKLQDIDDMKVSGDGKYVAVKNKINVYVWDTESEKVIYSKKSVVKKRYGFASYQIDLLFSPDNNFFCHVDPYGVHIVDLRQPDKKYFVHTDDFYSEYSLDDPYIPQIIQWSSDSCYLLMRTGVKECWMIDAQKIVESQSKQVRLGDVGYKFALDGSYFSLIDIDKEDAFFFGEKDRILRFYRVKTGEIKKGGFGLKRDNSDDYILGEEFGFDEKFKSDRLEFRAAAKCHMAISRDKKYLAVLGYRSDGNPIMNHVLLHIYDIQTPEKAVCQKKVEVFEKEQTSLDIYIDVGDFHFVSSDDRHLIYFKIREAGSVSDTFHWVVHKL